MAMDDTKDKDVRFGKLINNTKIVCDDLPVFKLTDPGKFIRGVAAFRIF